MHPLPLTFTLGHYTFTQVSREGSLAIYRQQHQEADVTRYEVVRIREEPEKVWPDGRVTPYREAYPGSTVWGKDGFTAFSLTEAQQIMRLLRARDTGETQEGAAPE